MAWTSTSSTAPGPGAGLIGSALGHGTGHAGAPLGVVAQLGFLQAEARIGNAELALDLEEFLELGRRDGPGWLPQLRDDEQGAAVGLEDFYLEIGVFDIGLAMRMVLCLSTRSATSWPTSGVPGVR